MLLATARVCRNNVSRTGRCSLGVVGLGEVDGLEGRLGGGFDYPLCGEGDSSMDQLLGPVSHIEGVGPVTEGTLAGAGVERVVDLVTTPGALLVAQTGSAHDDARAAAALLRVDELSLDVAEALVRAGIRTLEDLAEAGLQTVERACDRAVDERRMAEAPSLYRLAGFQRQACELIHRALVNGTVLVGGAPLDEGEARIGQRRRPIEAGRFVVDAIPPGDHLLSIVVPGRAIPFQAGLRLTAGDALARRFELPAPADDHDLSIVTSDERNGSMLTMIPNTRWRLVWGNLDNLAPGTDLVVQSLGSRPRLLDIFRTRIGDTVLITRYRVALDLLGQAQVKDAVRWNGQRFEPSPVSLAALQQARFEAVRSAQPARRRRRVQIGGTDD